MVAIPVMAGRVQIGHASYDNSANDISERTQYMTTAKNILISGGDAAERLMSSYKEVSVFRENLLFTTLNPLIV